MSVRCAPGILSRMDWLRADRELRAGAFAQAAALARLHGGDVPWSAIQEGFPFQGRLQPLASKAEGIYKPTGHPAALSVKTTVPRKGRVNVYADELASEDGLMRYSHKLHGGPDSAQNDGLRVAMRHQLPLIYFWGTSEGVYAPVFPVFVVDEDRDARLFHLAPGSLATRDPTHVHRMLNDAPEKRYAAILVRQRLHQRRFRQLVLDAYDNRCAICTIHHPSLVEAAHILPDRDERGRPEVPNGLALCSLHHEAFDRYLVDIDETYTIRLSETLRKERDGKVFEEAFLARDNMPMNLPRRLTDFPKREYLSLRIAERPS